MKTFFCNKKNVLYKNTIIIFFSDAYIILNLMQNWRSTADCGKLNNCAVRPSEDKWLSFSNYCRKERVPFVVYTNLECTLETMKKEDMETLSYTYQRHQIFSIMYYVHCSYDDSLSKYRFRRNNDCIAWLAEELKNLAYNVKTILSTNVFSWQILRETIG